MRTTLVAAALCALLMATAFEAISANRCVVEPGTAGVTPTPPYTSWATAGTNIKEVVDVANANNAGDLVIVSNGTYWLTNEISVGYTVVTNASGDRTQVVINGNFPAYTNRCFYVHNGGAGVVGLTITNGALTNTIDGGAGVRLTAGYVRNCVIAGNQLWYAGGNSSGGGGIIISAGAEASDCDIIGNTIYTGLETYSGGGGACVAGRLNRSYLAFNVATNFAGSNPWNSNGGGALIAEPGSVYQCTIVSNYSYANRYGIMGGGGVYLMGGSLSNSFIMYNYATAIGGGVAMGFAGANIRNCVMAFNRSPGGGGIQMVQQPAMVENCTVVSNYPNGVQIRSAWGSPAGNIVNCIFYWNQGPDLVRDAPSTYSAELALAACCVSPAFGSWINPGGTTNDPLLVSIESTNFRLLSAQSSCYNHGVNLSWMTGAVDLDGHRRIDRVGNAVDIGAYELLPSISMIGFH